MAQIRDQTVYDENTLKKVFAAIDTIIADEDVAQQIVLAIMNAGIVFRERAWN